jgi:predicted nucleic acid-binding protein
MSDKVPCFVDSNVWLYIFLPGQDKTKATVARQLVRSKESQITISAQIINEVINNLLRNVAMDEAAIRELIKRFYARYTVHSIFEATQERASHLRESYSLSHWDSLVVAAALQADTSILYTEDMQDGLIVANQLTIVNPFAL